MDEAGDRFWDAQIGRLLAGHRDPAPDDARLHAIGESLADRLATERTVESNLASMIRHYEEPPIDAERLASVGERVAGMLGTGRAPEPVAGRPPSSGRWKALSGGRRVRRVRPGNRSPAARWWAVAAAAAVLLAVGVVSMSRNGVSPRPVQDRVANASTRDDARVAEAETPGHVTPTPPRRPEPKPEPRVVVETDRPGKVETATPAVLSDRPAHATPVLPSPPAGAGDRIVSPSSAGEVPPLATVPREPDAAPASRAPAVETQTTTRISTVALARLDRVTGAVQVSGPEGPVPARAGAPLLAGQTIRTGEGTARAQVRFPDGTRMELGADTEAALQTDADGGKRVVLARGAVVADVTKQPAGSPMRFATARAEAVVLGTRLRYSATTDATRLDVQEGRVRMTRVSDGSSADVGAGQFAVAVDGAALTAMAAAPPPARPGEPVVTGFTLINADTDQPVPGFDPIENGTVLNLASLPTRKLNVRANTQPEKVGSVLFVLDGRPRDRAEWRAPYALFGDATKGDYSAWTPAAGEHTLSAIPYEHVDARGQAGRALTLVFYVVTPRGK